MWVGPGMGYLSLGVCYLVSVHLVTKLIIIIMYVIPIRTHYYVNTCIHGGRVWLWVPGGGGDGVVIFC